MCFLFNISKYFFLEAFLSFSLLGYSYCATDTMQCLPMLQAISLLMQRARAEPRVRWRGFGRPMMCPSTLSILIYPPPIFFSFACSQWRTSPQHSAPLVLFSLPWWHPLNKSWHTSLQLIFFFWSKRGQEGLCQISTNANPAWRVGDGLEQGLRWLQKWREK